MWEESSPSFSYQKFVVYFFFLDALKFQFTVSLSEDWNIAQITLPVR